MSPVDIAPVRKYRSRKQKPCDNCRRRRVCCVRDAEGDCALCSRRSIPCTFSSEPERRLRRPKPDGTPRVAIQSVTTDFSSHSVSNPVAPVAPVATTVPNTGALDKLPGLDGRRGAGEGKYVGLTGTEDVYFDVERDQVIGNDPAKEAYFRGRASSSTSVLSDASTHRARSIEPDAAIVQTIFLERSHPAIPLLDESRIRDPNQSRMLTNAIAIISKYTSPELEGLHNNVLIEELTSSLLLEARSPTLETVEAAVLFTQRALRGKMSTSAPGMWAVIGALVGMCHDLGLNIDCSTWSIPEYVRKRRKRIWWAAYTQDKWFAMALGRPSFIHATNTTSSMLTAADFEDADHNPSDTKRPELVTGVHCFVAFAELSVILNEILSVFFTVSSVVNLREVTGDHIIKIHDRIDEQLEIWRGTYLDQILTQRFFPDVTGSLELAYLTVRIMLLRGIFPKLYRRNLSLDRHVESAIQVTSGVISLVETLQINRLSAFWWSCSGFNFALAGTFMASLKRLSVEPERAAYWDSRLSYYRRLLSAHGFSFWPAKFAATALDHMAKGLTKAGNSNPREHATGTIEALATPATSWSGGSYDFFPQNLSGLEPFTEWWPVDDFQWQQMYPNGVSA